MSSRRNRGGGGDHGGGGEERWLLPYADMITLLLGLFIVLFAMSSIDAKQFDNVKRSLAQTFSGEVLEEPGGVLPGATGVLDPNAASDTQAQAIVEMDNASRTSAQRFDEETKQLEQLAKQLNLGNDVQVVRNQVGIQVRLAGDALFESGSWELKPGMKDKLKEIEREMAAFGHPIEIAGHTDGVPYAGQWGNLGLSQNRAAAVYSYFADLGYPPSLMEAVGFADTRPIKPPPTPNASIAANRRIEITILEPAAKDGFANLTSTERIVAIDTAPNTRPAPIDPSASVKAEIDAQFPDPLVSELAQTAKAPR
jgi:chemotaxis protein MotB